MIPRTSGIIPAASPAHNHHRRRWFWVILTLFLIGMVFLLTSDVVRGPVDAAITWAEGLMDANPVLAAGVFFLLSMLSAALNFTTSVVLVPSADLAWGKTITFFLLWAGYIAGAIMAYGIGRLARPLVNKMGYEEKMRGYQQFVDSRMKFWMVILVCIAAQSELSGYLFGSLHYAFARYIAAMILVEGFYAYLIVIAGQGLVKADPVTMLVSLAAFAMIAIGAGYFVERVKKKGTGGA